MRPDVGPLVRQHRGEERELELAHRRERETMYALQAVERGALFDRQHREFDALWEAFDAAAESVARIERTENDGE